MKKLFSMLMAMTVCVGMTNAERVLIGDLYYNLSTDPTPTAEVTWEIQEELGNYINLQSIKIPGSVEYNGETYIVNAIGDYAFSHVMASEVSIPSSVKTIGQAVFSFVGQIESLVIPEGVQSIGKDAFAECWGLKRLELPSTLQVIGERVINNSDELVSLTIAKDNPMFDSRDNCNAIIETKTNTLLHGCTGSTIPNTITTIADYAFWECEFTSMTIPSSVTKIGAFAFEWCDQLTSITIPASVVRMDEQVFYACKSLESIVVENGNPTYDSRNKCNAIIETKTNTLLAGCKNTIIPEDITAIADAAFCSQKGITSITIPAGVKTIGHMAFAYMENLKELTCLAEVPPTADKAAFSSNYYATPADIPVYVPKGSIDAYKAATGWDYFTNYKAIGGDEEQPVFACIDENGQGTCGENLKWFVNCTKDTLIIQGTGAMTDFGAYSNKAPWSDFSKTITTIIVEEGVTSIGKWAFHQFAKLNKVVLPEGLTRIGYVAFDACEILEEISLPSTLVTLEDGVFSGDRKLKSLTIPANVKSIGNRMTEKCVALESIVVEEGNTVYDSRNKCNAIIETKSNKLIAGCKNSFIPSTVETIGAWAFSSCEQLAAITIPNSVTTLEMNSFEYCKALKSFTVPSSIVSIDPTTFYACAFEQIVVHPENPVYDSRDNCNAIIETKTNTLFKGGVNTVIPDEIVAIGKGAFYNMAALEFINIPANVKSVGQTVFYNCRNLKAITSYAVEPPTASVEQYLETFKYVPADIPVYVPAGSADKYKAAIGWSQFTNYVELTNNFTVKALANHGKVNGTGTYAANTEIKLTPVADEGFAFKQWSDGTNDNPKTLVVTKDTTIRAMFEKIEQPQVVVVVQGAVAPETQLEEVNISFETIEGTSLYELKIYKNGKLVSTAKLNSGGELVGEIEWAAPSRMKIREAVSTDPSIISVTLSELEFGQEYTFTLDAYNEAEECIAAVAGTFKAEKDDTTTDASILHLNNAPRKLMQDGRMMIILPEGKRYDATGIEM